MERRVFVFLYDEHEYEASSLRSASAGIQTVAGVED